MFTRYYIKTHYWASPFSKYSLALLLGLLLWMSPKIAYVEEGWPQGQSPVSKGYQAAFRYLGESADNDDHRGWFNETQGIANGDPSIGDGYWYLSKNIEANANTHIYRVSYTEHLANHFDFDDRTIRLPGGSSVCDHIGDIDYHVYNGQGYIVAAYEGCGDGHGRIAFFRADDIDGSEALLYREAVMDVYSVQRDDAPWVCVRNDGRVYSSSGSTVNTDVIFEYTISWDDIEAGRNPSFQARSVRLKYENGNDASLEHRQGADFSTDGELFYIVVGTTSNRYIHVFKVSGYEWTRIRASSQSYHPFKFHTQYSWHEPEGLSYFDLNDVHPYHPTMPRGELFVVLLNNGCFGDDCVWIKHYTSIIDVNPQDGLSYAFFSQWGEGAWNGSILALEPGTYNEQIELTNRKVKLVPKGGTAVISGNSGGEIVKALTLLVPYQQEVSPDPVSMAQEQ